MSCRGFDGRLPAISNSRLPAISKQAEEHQGLCEVPRIEPAPVSETIWEGGKFSNDKAYFVITSAFHTSFDHNPGLEKGF